MNDRMSIWERFKYRNGSKAHLAAIQDNIEALAARTKEAEADRDRARSIAVALEQETAALTTALDLMTAEAEAAHGVIEQAGLLQEHMATLGLTGAEALRQVLNGGRFEEVRRG